MKRPRVVFVFDSTLDVRYVDGFPEIFDLTLFSPAWVRTTNEPKVASRHIKVPGGRVVFPFRVAWWLLRNRRAYDVIFVLDNLTAATGVNLAAKLLSKPVVLVLMRPAVEYFRCRAARGQSGWRFQAALASIRLLKEANERMATAAAPCSKHIASTTKTGRIVEIPCYGVDVKAYAPHVSKAEARQQLGLPEDDEIVFCRSRIAPEKDPETFLKASEIVRRHRGERVKVLYVGGEYEEFLQLAEGYEVEVIARDHVHPLEELPLYYIASDVSVQTSLAEGLGLSPLESVCCGTPVVVSATGGLLETIREGDTGLQAPVRDARKVAEAVEWLLEHPSEGQAMADRARALVERSYSASIAFQRWAELAGSLAGQTVQ